MVNDNCMTPWKQNGYTLAWISANRLNQ